MADSKGPVTYTGDEVARAFGGSIAFGKGAAAKVAAELSKLDLANQHPDSAGRDMQAAVERATKGDDDRSGALVSIDTCVAALAYMHAQHGFAGEAIGGGDAPPVTVTQPAPEGGTAAQAGAASSGPGPAGG